MANQISTATPLISLRPEGLYCALGDFYIDPWLPVRHALITHAHGDHAAAGSSYYLAHHDCVPLLKIRLQPGAQIHGVAYGEEQTLGAARVSLHPAGHILGSAQIRVAAETEKGPEVWVVSGDYKRGFDPTCQPFEVVPCDVFITEATFAAPIYRWQSGAEVASEVLSWWQDCARQGSTAVLFCYALGKAQRILAELQRLGAAPEEPVLLHGAMLALTQAYREAGVAMLQAEYFNDSIAASSLPGRLVLAPPSAYRSPWMRRFKSFETGFASGWVRVRGALRQRGHDRAFVLSDHADWPELVRTIQETGASKTLVTHGRTELLVRWLRQQGMDAEALSTSFAGDSEEDD